MATIRRLGIGDWGLRTGDSGCQLPVPRPLSASLFAFLLFAFAFALSACASTQPVAKIALLAPFEGLYRQEGYDALAAMRAAIAEQCPMTPSVLPLALDTSRDVARTAQTALADPAVVAIVGPYWAADGLAVAPLAGSTPWLRPYAPGNTDDWAAESVNAAKAFAQAEGRTLLLAGATLGWPGMDGTSLAAPGDVPENGAVLWLGDAAAGADFALAMWNRQPGTPFGIYTAGVETFRQRVGGEMGGPIFLVGWIDAGYLAWAENHSPNTPAAYTIYRQTADAICDRAEDTPAAAWQPGIFLPGADDDLALWSGD